MSLTMQAWFRAVAAAFKSEATAQSVAGICRSISFIYLRGLFDACRNRTFGYGHIHVRLIHSLLTLETHAGSSGYTVPKHSMVGALRWISYINVLSHVFPGMKLN